MPVYLLCPHCEHPQVVAPHRRGKTQVCRQCGKTYQLTRFQDDILVTRRTMSGAGSRNAEPVYVID